MIHAGFIGNPMKTYPLFVVLMLFVNHCVQGQSVSSEAVMADVVLRNGAIYTVDPVQPWVEALAVVDGTIVFAGSNTDVVAFIDAQTQVFELDGRMVLPGLHDVHMHPLEAGSSASSGCVLDNQEDNPENFIRELRACNLRPNENGWILASGHSIFTLYDAQRPPREILDDLFPNDPVAVLEETSHSLWVNSRALEMVGFDAATPDPVGGHIIRWDDGAPSGLLLDNAGDVILQQALASTPTIDAQNYDGLVNESLPFLASLGLTSITEARTYWKRNYHRIWQDIKADGLLTVRVALAPWLYPEDADTDLVAALRDLYDTGDDMLRITQIKCYSDGITINATAALHEPYVDNLGLPFDRGLNYIEGNRLANMVAALEQVGYDFHIHTIGDRGVTEALDAIAFARNQNGDIGARHRLTHLEIVDPLDLNRFAALNVTADVQVAGDFTNPENWSENEAFLGRDRSDNIVPLRSLYEAGARIALSSDWDVSTANPFVGMEQALTRSPQALPTLEEVIKAYTLNAAYVMRQEDRVGSLEVGKYADLVVLNQNLFDIPIQQIRNTNVLLTLLAGREVYRDASFTGVVDGDLPDLDFTLDQNYPNPFLETTDISFTLNVAGSVQIRVYDTVGKRVADLLDGHRAAGSYTLAWNGTDSTGRALPSGVYYYQLETSRARQAKKMLLIR